VRKKVESRAGGQKGHFGVEIGRDWTRMRVEGRGREVIALVGGGEKMPPAVAREWNAEAAFRRVTAKRRPETASSAGCGAPTPARESLLSLSTFSLSPFFAVRPLCSPTIVYP